MRTLDRRVRQLEQALSTRATPTVRLLWDDEVRPCVEHRGCLVVEQSGDHVTNVVRLSFGEDYA